MLLSCLGFATWLVGTLDDACHGDLSNRSHSHQQSCMVSRRNLTMGLQCYLPKENWQLSLPEGPDLHIQNYQGACLFHLFPSRFHLFRGRWHLPYCAPSCPMLGRYKTRPLGAHLAALLRLPHWKDPLQLVFGERRDHLGAAAAECFSCHRLLSRV